MSKRMMSGAVLLVAAAAMVAMSFAFVAISKASNDEVTQVASQYFDRSDLMGGSVGFHEGHRTFRFQGIDKSALKLRANQRVERNLNIVK
ncbi:hypothetical protein K8I61_05160 [bacterium]|nr:hypothetical protein [bacterium]